MVGLQIASIRGDSDPESESEFILIIVRDKGTDSITISVQISGDDVLRGDYTSNHKKFDHIFELS